MFKEDDALQHRTVEAARANDFEIARIFKVCVSKNQGRGEKPVGGAKLPLLRGVWSVVGESNQKAAVFW
jgi:hypothetical protein